MYGEPQEGVSEAMGRLIARFSIGVVSVASIEFGQNNLTVAGMQPSIGSRLVVDHWVFVWLIVSLLVGIQGAGFVFTACWANRVLVKDQSFLSTARLFKPFIERLENCGTAARGKEICKALGAGPETEVIYRVTTRIDDGVRIRQLEFGPSARERAFPKGVYDCCVFFFLFFFIFQLIECGLYVLVVEILCKIKRSRPLIFSCRCVFVPGWAQTCSSHLN